MPSNFSPEQKIENALKGVKSLEQVQKIISDPLFKKFWKELGKDVQKKIVINTKITGAKDVEDLVDSMNAAIGATEQYFRKLDKYRSVMTQMNLAYKEGNAHMREHLEQAAKSGGKMAVVAAATSYLVKTLADQVDGFRDAIKEVKRYNIEQERFQKSSQFSAQQIMGLRNSLSLTKKDMSEFFSVLKKGETMGFGADQIQAVFKNLKQAYGNDAMDMMTNYQEILSKMPTLSLKIQTDPSSELNGEELYEIMKSGNLNSVIEMKSAGLFGGAKDASKSAEMENYQKRMEYLQETVKDVVADNIPKMLVALADISLIGTQALGVLTTLVGIMGASKALAGAGSLIKTGGAIKEAAAMGGAGAGVKGLARAGLGGLGFTGLGAGALGLTVAGGVAGLGLAAAGGSAYKMYKDLGYMPSGSEMWKASKEAMKNGEFGYSDIGMTTQEMTPEEKKAMSSGGTGRYRKIGGKVQRQTMGQAKADVDTMKSAGKIYERVKMAVDRWDAAQEDAMSMAQNIIEIAEVTGNSKDYFNALDKYSTAAQERFNTDKELLERGIQEAKDKVTEGLKTAGFEKSSGYETLKNTIKMGEMALIEKTKNFNETFAQTLESITFLIKLGSKGYANTLGLQMAEAKASSGVAISKTQGGEFTALKTQRDTKIATAENSLKGIENAIKENKAQQELHQTGVQRIKLEEQAIDLENKRAQAIESVNDAVGDVSDIEFLNRHIERMKSLLSDVSSLVRDTNGSYESMVPLMTAQIEKSREEVLVSKMAFDQWKANPSYGKEGTEAYERLKTDYLQKEVNYEKEKFELAKQSRDYKKEEIEFASSWLSEQADYMDEMGGFFGDVMSKRTQALQKEREMVGVLSDYLQNDQLSGFARQKAEVELEKTKMKITKDTIGIQKSSYEKFVGMAFGALGDVGFKKGRMDDAVLMGTAGTRIKNRAGLYTGSGIGMNRDQLSALRATGFSSSGVANGAESVKSGFAPGEEWARRTTGLSASKTELSVAGKVEISLSDEFRKKVESWTFDLIKDPKFVTSLKEAGNLVSKEGSVSTTGA